MGDRHHLTVSFDDTDGASLTPDEYWDSEDLDDPPLTAAVKYFPHDGLKLVSPCPIPNVTDISDNSPVGSINSSEDSDETDKEMASNAESDTSPELSPPMSVVDTSETLSDCHLDSDFSVDGEHAEINCRPKGSIDQILKDGKIEATAKHAFMDTTRSRANTKSDTEVNATDGSNCRSDSGPDQLETKPSSADIENALETNVMDDSDGDSDGGSDSSESGLEGPYMFYDVPEFPE